MIKQLKSKLSAIRNLLQSNRNNDRAKKSYAQCGEDLIIDFLIKRLGLNEVTYLDIGAHHPKWLSNTFYFYMNGFKGILIEPDEHLSSRLRKARPRDNVLSVAVGAAGGKMLPLYVMSSRSLNTLDQKQANDLQASGNQKIEATIQVPVLGINDILKTHFPTAPTFVSLDIEGMDLEILTAWDFSVSRPPIFCVETLTYSLDNSEEKITSIVDYMKSVGYLVYADTHINTIFVSQEHWRNRPTNG